jgi:hypothetical protein
MIKNLSILKTDLLSLEAQIIVLSDTQKTLESFWLVPLVSLYNQKVIKQKNDAILDLMCLSQLIEEMEDEEPIRIAHSK